MMAIVLNNILQIIEKKDNKYVTSIAETVFLKATKNNPKSL